MRRRRPAVTSPGRWRRPRPPPYRGCAGINWPALVVRLVPIELADNASPRRNG